jgi:hypothetical protein
VQRTTAVGLTSRLYLAEQSSLLGALLTMLASCSPALFAAPLHHAQHTLDGMREQVTHSTDKSITAAAAAAAVLSCVCCTPAASCKQACGATLSQPASKERQKMSSKTADTSRTKLTHCSIKIPEHKLSHRVQQISRAAAGRQRACVLIHAGDVSSNIVLGSRTAAPPNFR